METENYFELGNEESKYSVEFGESPSFYISNHNLPKLTLEFEDWTRGFLRTLGYDGDIDNLEYQVSEEQNEVNIVGSFGTLLIKNNGGMEYTRNDEPI
jgi:hypothetical protein